MSKNLSETIKEPYFKISHREQRLIEELRKIPYGEVTVFQENSQPVRLKKVIESVKLDN